MGLYWKAFKLIFPALKNNKLLSFGILSLHLIIIGILVCNSYWFKYFYDALLTYDPKLISKYCVIFIIMALFFIFFKGIKSYLEKFLEFKIRENLYGKYKKIWHLTDVTNPEQRMHEDIIKLGREMIPLIEMFIKSIIEFPVYLFVIFKSTNIYILVIILFYVFISTYLSARIAKPLVLLENLQEKREAEFRKGLTYLMDKKYKNSIEELPTLDYIKENWIQLAKKTMNLNFYTSSYSQFSVFFQLLIFLPSYIAKKITIGQFIQNASAIARLIDSISIFINNRSAMIDVKVIVIRLLEMENKKLEN